MGLSRIAELPVEVVGSSRQTGDLLCGAYLRCWTLNAMCNLNSPSSPTPSPYGEGGKSGSPLLRERGKGQCGLENSCALRKLMLFLSFWV
ncbi:MAG TPA: hypothetical protein V6D19_10080 [Stenomitos sp.]